MNTIEELQKCIYDTLYEMRLAPRHQIEQAAGLITTRLQPIIDSMKAQEPVAWIRYGSDGNPIDVLIGDEPMEFLHGRNAPLYAAPQVPEGMVMVPREPSDGLLMSMAFRFDHGLGCPGYYDMIGEGMHKNRLQSTMTQMRQIYEEIVGEGFYSKEKDAHYTAMIDAAEKRE